MRSLALFFFTIILRCSSAFVSHSFGQPFKFHPTTHAPLLLANGMKGVCNVPRRKTGPPSFCPLRMDSGSEGGGNFVLRYLDDIILYLDSKGGYVISDSQLKSGLRDQDIADMQAAFDTPKRQPSPLSINVFLVSITALPLMAWLWAAAQQPCDILLHLCPPR